MKRVAAAFLVCAVMVLVAAVPLVGASAHQVVMGHQGPRASAVSWVYAPTDYGTWTGHIVNSGLKSLIVDVDDVTTGAAASMLHERIRFAASNAYPSGTVDTLGVIVAAGHKYQITVTPNGPKGSSCTVEDVFGIPPPPPVALFTLTTVGLTVMVDGSSSYDPYGLITEWAWDWGDGTISWPSATPTATHTYLSSGTYTIELIVLSSTGMTGSVSHVIWFWPPPPVMFTYTVIGMTVMVDASANYDHLIVSYAWNWGDGSTGTGVTATHTYAASGTYNITLTVTDTIGQMYSTSHIIYLFGPPPPPVAAFVFTVNGYTVGVDASTSIANQGIVSYSWNWGDGSSAGSGVTAAHTYTEVPALVKTITLTITDTVGSTASCSKPVTLQDSPPVGSFTGTVNGLTVSVNASASTDDHGIVSYSWNWGDTTTGTGRIVTHTYAQSGTYNITLTVTSHSGLTGSVSHAVTVAVGTPPVALFTATVNGTTVSVDASASTSDVGIVSYAWNFDNLVIAYGVTHSHIYVSHGIYTVTLTITDALGNMNSSIQAVTVSSSLPVDSYWYTVYGMTYESDGLTPLGGCALTITNVRTGETMIGLQSDGTGFYGCDVTPLTTLYGDSLIVQATGPSGQTGSATKVIDFSMPYMSIDVTLS